MAKIIIAYNLQLCVCYLLHAISWDINILVHLYLIFLPSHPNETNITRNTYECNINHIVYPHILKSLFAYSWCKYISNLNFIMNLITRLKVTLTMKSYKCLFRNLSCNNRIIELHPLFEPHKQ